MPAPPMPAPPMRPCLIVAGPTASGKSALALHLARALGGTVVNADAMQCYRDLRVLTARPSPDDEALAPHALYGTLDAARPGTAASWREAALAALSGAAAAGRLPILCGGTGLYLEALLRGLAAIPDPGDDAREAARGMLARLGPAALRDWLMARDPDTAGRLRPTDGQRLARAAEVLLGTGRGLAAWRAAPGLPPAPYRFLAIRLAPGRDALSRAIAARFDAMLAAGALDEVRALLGRGLPAATPLLRAHGVPELSAHLARALPLEEARAGAIASTLAYTRRQRTWARHHPLADPALTFHIDPEYPLDAQYAGSETWVRDTISKMEG